LISIKNSESPLSFVKSLFVSMTLALSITPIILLLTSASITWVVLATLLWAFGTILVFHPFILYVYPHLLSKISAYILTSILIIISAWFNITIITLLLPYDYIYYSLFNATLAQIALWGSLYIIVLNSFITNFIIISEINFYKEESLF